MLEAGDIGRNEKFSATGFISFKHYESRPLNDQNSVANQKIGEQECEEESVPR